MKLRLPNKLVAAIVAAASPVLFQTLSSVTVGTAAAVMGQQVMATNLYTTPAFGGTQYTWTGGDSGTGTDFNVGTNWAGDEVPNRTSEDGPVYIFDGKTVALTNTGTYPSTSDRGGVKVINGANVSGLNLGIWAGAVYVGAGSVLSATYTKKIKNTEAGTAANVYVDGTFTLSGTGNEAAGKLNLDDGMSYQNWYIGEQGIINLAGIKNVVKGTKEWNVQLKLSDSTDISALQNRTASSSATVYKTFMTAAADLFDSVNSWSVYRSNADGTSTELASTAYTIHHNAACMAISYTGNGVEKMNVTWSGGAGNWKNGDSAHWTAADGTTTSFVNGDSVTFSGTGNVATVQEFVYASTVALANQASATLDITTAGAALEVEKFSLGGGASLTLKPKADSTKAVVEHEFAYQYRNVTFTAASSADDPAQLVVDSLASLYFADGLHFEQGNSFATVQTNAARNQFINGLFGSSATLNLVRSTGAAGGSNADNGRAGYFCVENLQTSSFSGTINLKTDAYGSNRDGLGGLIVYNSSDGLKNTYVNFESGTGSSVLAFIESLESAQWDGTTQNDWTRKLKGSSAGSVFQDGEVGGLGGSKGTVYANNLTVNVTGGAEYDYSGSLDVKALTKTGEGAQTISSLWNQNCLVFVKEGTLKLAGGATLNSPVTNDGTLSLGGTINVAFDATEATTQYIDSNGTYTGNGYKETISGGYHVVVGNGVTNVLEGAAWQINGVAAEGYTFEGGYLKSENFSANTDKTVYYIQVAGSTHDYDSVVDASATSFVLNGENSTLVLDGEVPERLASISVNGATANIKLNAGALLEGSVLSTTNNGTAKLMGSGTVSLVGLSLPARVSVEDAAWTGTVRVSTSNMDDTATSLVARINALANSGSSVELKGVGGWLENNVTRAVVLTGTGEEGKGTALKINNGGSGNIRWFTGKVSGSGDFEFAWTNTTGQGTKFTGSVSEWTGWFKTTGQSTRASKEEGGLTLEFSDSATVINAGISHDRDRELAVTFTNDHNVAMNGDIVKGEHGVDLNLVAAATEVTFTGNVAADKLTINAGKAAVFDAVSGKTQSIGALDGSGTLKVDAAEAVGGRLQINGDINDFTGTVYANGGRLELTNGAETPAKVALSGIFVNDGVLELSGGQYTVGGTVNTNGLFADESSARSGSLVLNNGASLDVNATQQWWLFQVNSGEGGGIYVKGKSEGDSGTTSALTATLHDGGKVSIKARDTASEAGAHVAAVSTGNGKSFAVDQTYITIEDADYTVNYGATDKIVENKLQNTALVNEGTGTLTANNEANTLVSVYAKKGGVVVSNTGSSAQTLKSVMAEGGDVSLLNVGVLELTGLTVKSGRSLTIGGSPAQTLAVGEADAAPATAPGVKVTDTVTLEGGSTISGGGLNLTETKTLTIDNISNDSTITLNSALVLPTERQITLDGNILTTLAWLGKDRKLEVFKGVTSLTLGSEAYTGVIDAAEATDLTKYFTFTGLEAGSYSLGYTGAADGGVVYIQKDVPEPTTATLSLLALAALAARRRRKN